MEPNGAQAKRTFETDVRNIVRRGRTADRPPRTAATSRRQNDAADAEPRTMPAPPPAASPGRGTRHPPFDHLPRRRARTLRRDTPRCRARLGRSPHHYHTTTSPHLDHSPQQPRMYPTRRCRAQPSATLSTPGCSALARLIVHGIQ